MFTFEKMTGWNTPPCTTVCLSSPVMTTGSLLEDIALELVQLLELDFTEELDAIELLDLNDELDATELLDLTEELLGGTDELEGATLELDCTEELDAIELLDFTDELDGISIVIPLQRTLSTYR